MEEQDTTSTRLESRAKQFAQGFDADDLKRRKDEHGVELRKSKRADLATKRRNLTLQEKEWISLNDHYKQHYSLEDLPQLIEAMNSNDSSQYLFSAQGFRKMLSLEHDPPIQQVIDAGVVPFLIDWVQHFDHPQLQFEAGWALTNIASGTHQHCQVIVEKGAVPLLVKLLESPNEEVREQAVWAVGNIGGDSAHCRDLVLQNNGLHLLIQCITLTQKQSMVKNGSWALSNLCRGKPGPDWELVKDAIPVLAKIVQEQHDVEILGDCLWALSHLSEGAEHHVDALIETGALPRVIQLMNHHLYNVQLPSTRTVGNVVTGNTLQTQAALNLGAAQAFSSLLNSPKKNVRKEAVWSISNVCAGEKEQLEALFGADVFKRLCNIAYHDEKEIKKEAVWALTNAVAGGSSDQVARLVQTGVIQALCSLLTQQEAKIVSIALEGTNRVLKCGREYFTGEDGNNPFCTIMDECGGLEKLEKLQTHPNTHIYEKARKIIEEYFEIEQDENDQLIQAIKECSTFSF